MKKFHEMLAKKRDMKPSEKHAKLGVLKDLKHSLADSMGDKLDGMKKVSVMSNSPQGLSAGLDKAKMMSQNPGMEQDPQMMSEGGLANAGLVDSDESYHGYGPMDESAQSMQDPNEPEHVSYDGSPDAKMGPGYFKGGEVGPNEADASDVTYSGDASGDDGFKHSNSDEDSDVSYNGNDFGAREHDSDEPEHVKYMNKGGKVPSPMDEAAESVDEERGETMSDMGDDNDDEHAMSVQKLQEKIDHLMRLKKQMEKQ